ncbi:MAG: tetratricopeptide repeat protein [Prevotella sp.]|nr:tetratricopeptide repeat protein [Prevotella sp.]MBR1840003.1 tetratricopeptide repeat protein [Prevotella sp.]
MKSLLSILLMLCSLSVSANKYRYYYIEAVRQQDMENYAAAFELFRHCYELNPDAPEVNYALGMFYMVLQQDSIGVAYLKRATELEPDNDEFCERLAQTYLYQNNIEAATDVYEALVKRQPDRTEYLELLLRIYRQQHDYPKILSTLDRIELQEGQTESVTLEKMRIRSMMDDNEGAYRELKSLIDAHPFDMNLQVMLGNWYLNQGKKKEALATFDRVLQEEPDNAQAQMSLMDYYRSEGEINKADTLLYDILVNPRTDSDTRLDLIGSWVRDSESRGGDSLRVIQVFDRVLALPQQTADVAVMKAAYMELKKYPSADIQQAWRDVLRIAPDNSSARLQLIQQMWRDSIDDNVIRECEKAVEYIPDEPALFYYLGLAQFINKRNKDAISSLRRGANSITNETNKDIAADIYALLGDIYQKEGRIQETYVAYDSCLVYNPDKVLCLNNYAYFLSEEGKDLKKAEKMSYRAITAEANNAVYLDTYAWILYKQKRYEDAKAYIDMALENLKEGEDADGEIAKHAEMINKKLKKK